jgi:hypothetical protein
MKVSGLVLSKQSGRALPNLIVSWFSAASGDALLSAASGSDAQARLAASASPSVALASVLTDASGRFELDLPAPRDSGSAASHALLAVLAPEDVTRADSPVALSIEKRLLFVTSVAYAGSGSQAHVIRLLPEQVQKFGLEAADASAQSARAEESAPQDYAAQVEQTFAFKDTVKKSIAPRLKAQADAIAASRTAAKGVFQNLSALSPDRRGHPQLLTDPSKLPGLMQSVATAGIDRLASLPQRLSLQLSADEVKQLGLKVGADGTVTGSVGAQALSTFVSARNGGVDLLAHPSNRPDPAALLQKYAAATKPGSGGSNP